MEILHIVIFFECIVGIRVYLIHLNAIIGFWVLVDEWILFVKIVCRLHKINYYTDKIFKYLAFLYEHELYSHILGSCRSLPAPRTALFQQEFSTSKAIFK